MKAASGPRLRSLGTSVLLILVSIVLVHPVFVDQASAYDDTGWSTIFGAPALPSGLNDRVWCSAMYNGSLYVAGEFTEANGVAVNRVARWTGTTWAPLGAGLDGPVQALAVYNGGLIAGGYFTASGSTPLGGIARWNGTSWSALGSGVESGAGVLALTVFGTDLIAAGDFVTAGGLPVHFVARWNGTAWAALSSGFDNVVFALAVQGTDLYAGGYLTASGGVHNLAGLAKWNGTSWGPVWNLDSAEVYSLAVWNGQLVVGGSLYWDDTGAYLGCWNGTSLTAIGGLSGGGYGYPRVLTCCPLGSNLVVLGDFDSAGGQFTPNGAIWTGTEWQSMDGGLGVGGGSLELDWGATVIPFGSGCLVGGCFEVAGSIETGNIAYWDGVAWSAMGTVPAGGAGLSGPLYALANDESVTLAGGEFRRAGGRLMERVGRWNDNAWLSLGGGFHANDIFLHRVSAISWFRGEPVVAYNQVVPGGGPVSQLFRWNGSQWIELTSIDGSISALLSSGDRLYVGGDFDQIGGITSPNVAAWDGSAWQTAGSMTLPVSSLAEHNGSVYAGASYLAYRLEGTSWVSIGNANGMFLALTSWGGSLIAGGSYTSINDAPANRLASWNGTSWSTVGAGVDGPVNALTTHEGLLAVGGEFTNVGAASLSANRIALWSGVAWNNIGSGVNGVVRALTSLHSRLYLGGDFTSAGTTPSFYMARWDGLTPAAVEPRVEANSIRMACPYAPGGRIRIDAAAMASSAPAVYDLQGRLVRRLAALYAAGATQGAREFTWDGRNESGGSVPSGVYFLRTEGPGSGRSFVLVR